MAGFPARQDNVFYLTEGGQETEIMYRHGHELPEFAMYPLLDDPAAMADLRAMYARVLDIAAEHGFVAMLGGLDYRGSPDWGDKLGYSRSQLAEALERGIGFLREVARRYPNVDIWGGCCGTWDRHLDQIAAQVKAAR